MTGDPIKVKYSNEFWSSVGASNLQNPGTPCSGDIFYIQKALFESVCCYFEENCRRYVAWIPEEARQGAYGISSVFPIGNLSVYANGISPKPEPFKTFLDLAKHIFSCTEFDAIRLKEEEYGISYSKLFESKTSDKAPESHIADYYNIYIWNAIPFYIFVKSTDYKLQDTDFKKYLLDPIAYVRSILRMLGRFILQYFLRHLVAFHFYWCIIIVMMGVRYNYRFVFLKQVVILKIDWLSVTLTLGYPQQSYPC